MYHPDKNRLKLSLLTIYVLKCKQYQLLPAMFLHKIYFKNFRLFQELLLEFEQQVTTLQAPNAKGKSTIIEGIHLLSTGSSFRAGKADEMIYFGKDLGRVRAKIYSNISALDSDLEGLDELELSVLLTRGELNGRRTRKQLFSVNSNRKRKKDFVGNLLTVVFRPEDMRLVEGSPSRRRDYLNDPLRLTDKEYDLSYGRYKKILRRRNKLLSLIKEGKQNPNTLTYWDMGLVKHGERLQQKRRNFVKFINAQIESPLPMRLKYEPSLISKKRIDSHKKAAMAAGFTLVGPHKDDFEVLLGLKVKNSNSRRYLSLDAYGSRGQKRMGVVWLKKAELAYVKKQTKQEPLLLLDDILSELDPANRDRVLNLVDQEQVIITTASTTMIAEIKNKFKDVKLIKLPKKTED